MYKIIRSKSKRQGNKVRVVHLWNSDEFDSFCNKRKTNGLKTSNYWFGESKSLPEDLCSLCLTRYKELESRIKNECLI